MKKTLLALSLIACLLLSFVGCGEDEIESEFKDAPVESNADNGNGNGTGENTTENTGDGTTGTTNENLNQGGANTENGWGPIITP